MTFAQAPFISWSRPLTSRSLRAGLLTARGGDSRTPLWVALAGPLESGATTAPLRDLTPLTMQVLVDLLVAGCRGVRAAWLGALSQRVVAGGAPTLRRVEPSAPSVPGFSVVPAGGAPHGAPPASVHSDAAPGCVSGAAPTRVPAVVLNNGPAYPRRRRLHLLTFLVVLVGRWRRLARASFLLARVAAGSARCGLRRDVERTGGGRHSTSHL